MATSTTPVVNIAILNGLFTAGSVAIKGKVTANSKANIARLNKAIAGLTKESEYDAPETKKFAAKLAKLAKGGAKVTAITVDEAGEKFSLEMTTADAAPAADPAPAAAADPAPAADAEAVPTTAAGKPKRKKKPAKPEAAAKPFVSKPVPVPGVRPTRSRPFLAGVVLLKHGLEGGITEEVVKEIDDMYVADGGGSNPRESRFSARNAWGAIRGYLNGDDVNKGLEMTKPKAKADAAPAADAEADAAAE